MVLAGVIAVPLAILVVVAVTSDWRAAKHGEHLRSARDISLETRNIHSRVSGNWTRAVYGIFPIWAPFRKADRTPEREDAKPPSGSDLHGQPIEPE